MERKWNITDSAPLNVQCFCWHEMTGNSSTVTQPLCQLSRRITRVLTPDLLGRCWRNCQQDPCCPAPPLSLSVSFQVCEHPLTPVTGKAVTAWCHTNRRFMMTSNHFPPPASPWHTHTHTWLYLFSVIHREGRGEAGGPPKSYWAVSQGTHTDLVSSPSDVDRVLDE